MLLSASEEADALEEGKAILNQARPTFVVSRGDGG